MIDESIKAVKAYMYDRAASPLLGAFVFSWVAWNYDVLLVLIATLPVFEKISYIKNNMSWIKGLACPLGSATAIIILYPLPAYGAYWLWKVFNKKINDRKRHIEGGALLTVAESRQLREEIANIKVKYEAMLRSKDKEIESVSNVLKNTHIQMDEYKSELATLKEGGKAEGPEIGDRILVHIASRGRNNIQHDEILEFAEKESIEKILADHAIDRLVEAGFVEVMSEQFATNPEYRLSPAGRQHLIENNLLSGDLQRSVWEEIEALKAKQDKFESAQSRYENSLNDLEEFKNNIELSKPVPAKVMEKIRKLEATRKVFKTGEKEFTYDDWFFAGVEEYGKGNYNKAAEMFVRASQIEVTPDSLGNAALCYMKAGNNERAEEYYRRAIEADPKNASILGNYALFLEEVRKDDDKAEEYFGRAIEPDPKHANNLGNYAVFLKDVRKDDEKAEEYYRRAIEADPKHADNLGNYAVFLKDVHKDNERAEEYYRRAIEADPKNASNLGNYAVFLKNVRKDYERAEEYYRRAIEADPKNASILGNYALFLADVRKDYERAEEYYGRAIEADPKYANSLGNYANFLTDVRKDNDRAEEYYGRAIEADPKHVASLGNYALFLADVRKDYERAEEYYRRAIEADPKHVASLGNYALFLADVRKDYERAGEYYRRAIEADPKHANNLGNYASFLRTIRKDDDRAEEYYRRAIEADPNHANILGNYAHFLHTVRKDDGKAKEYYRRAMEVDPKDANNLCNYAGFLFASGRRGEGIEYLEKAFAVAVVDMHILELWFYRYAHSEDGRDDSLREVKKLIVAGVRSHGFDLSRNVEQAIAEGHSEQDLLKVLARVIADDEQAHELEQFQAWRDA